MIHSLKDITFLLSDTIFLTALKFKSRRVLSSRFLFIFEFMIVSEELLWLLRSFLSFSFVRESDFAYFNQKIVRKSKFKMTIIYG